MPEGQAIPSDAQAGGAEAGSEQATQEVNQAEVQGTQQPDTSEEKVRNIQSIADKRLAENYRLRQQVDELNKRVLGIMEKTSSQNENPYDPATNYVQWQRWENQALVQQVLAEADKRNDQKLAGMIQQAQEMQWANAHPGVDIETVKAFAQMRGVQNLDDAYTLMTLPQNVQGAYAQASQNALNQFRQPQTGATPVRGGQSPPVQGKVTFKETLEKWSRDPSIENTWTPEFRADFERELNARKKLMDMGS